MAETTKRGSFSMDWEEAQQGRWNVYRCTDCRSDGRPHQIINVARGRTDACSTWGAGVPAHVRKCTGCGAEDGPWVSANDVGGCW